jgi:hypothetical protein
MFPFNRFVQQPPAAQPAAHPAELPQAPLAQARLAPDADNLNQRLDQVRQLQQAQQQLHAQQHLQRRLRLVQFHQQNMARQRAMLQQDQMPLRQRIEDANARIRDMERSGEARSAHLRRNPQ